MRVRVRVLFLFLLLLPGVLGFACPRFWVSPPADSGFRLAIPGFAWDDSGFRLVPDSGFRLKKFQGSPIDRVRLWRRPKTSGSFTRSSDGVPSDAVRCRRCRFRRRLGYSESAADISHNRPQASTPRATSISHQRPKAAQNRPQAIQSRLKAAEHHFGSKRQMASQSDPAGKPEGAARGRSPSTPPWSQMYWL